MTWPKGLILVAAQTSSGAFSISVFTSSDLPQQFMLAQLDSAEAGKGFFFWTAKTEDWCAPEWDLLWLIGAGIAPSDFCDRPTFCS